VVGLVMVQYGDSLKKVISMDVIPLEDRLK